jgi:hypothetical protein
MARKTVRVKVPTDPSELIALAGKIEAHSVDLGTASPLTDLEDAESYGPAVARAAEQDGLRDGFAQKAETATGERNKDLPAIIEGVRARRDLLLGLYRSNPKKLTEYGFAVDDTPQSSGGTGAPPATSP